VTIFKLSVTINQLFNRRLVGSVCNTVHWSLSNELPIIGNGNFQPSVFKISTVGSQLRRKPKTPFISKISWILFENYFH